MPVFYPSCVVNVKLKFDESLTVVDLDSPEAVDDRARQGGSIGTEKLSTEPLILKRDEENVSYVLGRIPKKASFELPGVRQAGQFNLTIDFKDLPIDPRVIRAASIEAHLGAIPASEFGLGMEGAVIDRQRTSVIATRDSSGQPNPDTLVMIGTVDEWHVDHTESGSEVSIKGRDMRGILLDTKLGTTPELAQAILDLLDLSAPINEVILQLLGFNPFFDQFTVVVNPEDWPNAFVPAPSSAAAVPRHRKGAKGNKSGGRANQKGSGSDQSFWDLIVRLCFLVGAIPYFQGTEIRIRPARSLYDQKRGGIDPTIPTPFEGGQQRSFDAIARKSLEPALSVRRFVYGRDVQSFSFDRKFGGGQRPQHIRVIGVDDSSASRGQERLVEAIWPPISAPERSKRTRVAPSSKKTMQEIVNIPIAGIRDFDQLLTIARNVYEEIGRGEVGGSIETKNLASFGGNNQDPDALRIKPGDAVEFLVDTRNLSFQTPLISTLTDHQRLSFEDQVAEIEKRIGDQNLARVIVATSRGQIQELQRFFRVQTVKYDWGANDGIKIAFDFQNFIVARAEVDADVSDQPGSAVRRSVPTEGT